MGWSKKRFQPRRHISGRVMQNPGSGWRKKHRNNKTPAPEAEPATEIAETLDPKAQIAIKIAEPEPPHPQGGHK